MKRILFVDDEPRILDGLRRMLRGQRHVWRVEMAAGGPEAISYLDRSAWDVVVTDMRMPGVDGVDVLEHARRTRPAAVRLILSGQTDRADAARAIAVAHQFIVKPSSADEVRGTIERVCANSALLADDVRAHVGRLASAPVLAENHAALRVALAAPDPSHERIVRIVGTDAGLAARVLQAVNSSFFGICRPVSQIAAAVRLLGLPLIGEIVAPESLHVMEHGAAESGAARAVAEASRRRAEGEGSPAGTADEGTRYAAALLADLGSLVLAARGIATPAPAARGPADITADTASRLTRYLLDLWNLPPSLAAHAPHTATRDDQTGTDPAPGDPAPPVRDFART